MVTNKQIIETKNRIGEILHSFNIGYQDINAISGPTVTLYELTPDDGVRISKIRNLKDELAVGLRVQAVRVIAPLPNGAIGIEVPNTDRVTIPFSEMLGSREYVETSMQLPLCLGRRTDNSILMVDLSTMPHLLVAGATGMGKSVGLNVIIASLVNKRSPEELKLVLVDPKQVEFSVYESIAKPYIAHLDGYSPICTEPEQARETLEAVIRLMESRYAMLKEKGVRNIMEYNMVAEKRIPYYVVIIDEYGDLIMQSPREMEIAICRIAQKARAVGIHMILSTQRPDAKIVTGSIKANFPTRIAFRTTTGTDSRVVLDRMGAEKLTGKGDMLLFQGADLVRCQCAYISTEEVISMCDGIRNKYEYMQQTTLMPPLPSAGNRSEELERVRNNAMRLIGYREINKWFFSTGSLYDTDPIDELQRYGIVGHLRDCSVGYSTYQAYPVLVSTESDIDRILGW